MSNQLLNIVKMPCQFRLHLLIVVLSIHAIYAANINKPLINGDGTDLSASSSDASPTNFNYDVTNQSIHSRAINAPPSMPFDVISNINSNNNNNNQTSGSGGSKLYNKANSRKRKMEHDRIDPDLTDWKCPNITENSRFLECGCDMPHTLRCSGDIHGLEQLARGLRASKYSVSLLDCTLKNVTFLNDARIFENVSLHGLVISSGEIKRVHRLAFLGMKTPLQTLGLPNNALSEVPLNSLSPLGALDRLDLSNNRIKAIGASDFLVQMLNPLLIINSIFFIPEHFHSQKLPNLTYLELSDNQISSISPKAFLPLKNLLTLKLNGNRLGEMPTSIQTVAHCTNLRELDLATNSIKGPLTRDTIPALRFLESLNLERNSLTSIQTGALQNFPFLATLSLRHNQIDVLQDHAFSGLSSLQMLDLGNNGIVAVSGASLQHLSRLTVLNLTHNFLRALTSDLIAPLPALEELRLDGNDISIVARNALDTAQHLRSLSLHDNPLSCDCSLKSFAEWMTQSDIPSNDLLGAVCATPPHLEGAPLFQIQLASLNCDGNVNKYDNADVLHQLETLSTQNNLTFVREFSDAIILKDIHLSPDYGLILTWSVNLNSRNFGCDAVFVYHESDLEATLMSNAPIKVHCESSKLNNENIVSVILRDTDKFIIGDNYRYCLALVERNETKASLIVGCSNITKLNTLESSIDTSDSGQGQTNFSDISHIDDMTNFFNENHESIALHNRNVDDDTEHMMKDAEPSTILSNPLVKSTNRFNESNVLENFSEIAITGLCIGIFLTIIFAVFWITPLVKNDRRSSPATICYAADDHIADIENTNRYLKLQATTTL